MSGSANHNDSKKKVKNKQICDCKTEDSEDQNESKKKIKNYFSRRKGRDSSLNSLR